jgi:hypothetical protein
MERHFAESAPGRPILASAKPMSFVTDHLDPVADRGVHALARMNQLDGELHRLALKAAADALLQGT